MAVRLTSHQLFGNHESQVGEEDIHDLLNEARYNLGMFAVEMGNYKEAVKLFAKVPLLEAAFDQGMCYKSLALRRLERSYNRVDDKEYLQEMALLEMAQQCFRQVLEQLSSNHKDSLYCKAEEEYEEVARYLDRLLLKEDPSELSTALEQMSGHGYTRQLNQPSVSTVGTPSSPHPANRSLIHSTARTNLASGHPQSLPLRHTQPNPATFDVQLQILSRSNRKMLEEFKMSRKSVQHLESRMDALENTSRRLDDFVYKKNRDVFELRNRVDTLELSNKKFDEAMQALDRDVKEVKRSMEDVLHSNRRRDEEINAVKHDESMNRREIDCLKNEFHSQMKIARDDISKLRETVKSLKTEERSCAQQQMTQSGLFYPGSSSGLPPQPPSGGVQTSEVQHMYGRSVPGAGFFSAVGQPTSATDMTIPKVNGNQQATALLPKQDDASQPAAGSKTQPVSAASVSGPNLFMLPQGSTSTSFPLPMPAAAKTPDRSTLTSILQDSHNIIASPEKYADEGEGENEVETTTPETNFGDFKPLVSLPQVTTASGEEDEIVMFSNRAKLYRFIEKQWKERGIGTIKILHNEKQGTVRILMRRDQVLKVCANHRIKADMEIGYKDENDKKILTWRAIDFTDETPCMEQFCCRFKTPEVTSEFKKMFEKAREIAKKSQTPTKAVAREREISTSKTPLQASFSNMKSDTKSVFSFGSTTFGTKSNTSASDMLKSLAAKSSVGEQQKIVGGFTFTATPIITEIEKVEAKASTKSPGKNIESADNKTKPFAGFSFDSSPQKASFTIVSKPSFPTLATSQSEPRDLHKKGFYGGNRDQPEKRESVVTTSTGGRRSAGDDYDETLLRERAKLYIYDTATKKWKERGEREIKILKNRKNGKSQILMQREDVTDVCVNHYITKEMSLQSMKGVEKSWCWSVQDLSNKEGVIDQFGAQFKDVEAAKQFKKIFDDCVKHASETSSDQTVRKEMLPLADEFSKKPGEWICDACYVVNKAESKHCVACESLKPGEKDECDLSGEVSSTSGITLSKSGGFQFSVSTSKGISFGINSNQPVVTSCSEAKTFTFGNSGFGSFNQMSDSKTLTEPIQDVEKMQEKNDSDEKCSTSSNSVGGTWKFGSEGGFKFNANFKPIFAVGTPFMPDSSSTCQSASKITSTSNEHKIPPSKELLAEEQWGSDADKSHDYGGKEGFHFAGVINLKQQSPKTPNTPLSPGDDGCYVNSEGEDDHIYFTPVVKLPEKVEIRTGEEDEELLYYQQAKLFRFIESEWKERGVGEVRILRHKDSKKTRILMRRDQVLKICMNHAITGDLELKPMHNGKGKAWVWHAEDFAEDKLVHEQFAIRFASEDLAARFKEAFNAARDHPDTMPVVDHVPDVKHSKSPTKEITVAKNEKSETSSEQSSGVSFSFKPPSVETRKMFGSSQVFELKDSKKPDVSKEEKTGKGGSCDRLLSELLAEPAKDLPSVQVVDDSDDDVASVVEEIIPEEKIKEARKWQLPDAFFLYEKRPQCKGCLGCLTDEFDFNTIGSETKVKVPQHRVKPRAGIDVEEKVSTVDKKEADAASSSNVIQFGKTSDFGDFAALAAKAGNTFAFGKGSGLTTPWAGAGRTLFSSSQHKSPKPDENDDNQSEEVEESPDIHFEPIVQLPEVVELKTGEEDEEKMFCHRAKLYRLDDGQWKERGVGEIKILKNKHTGRFRLLLRREQVLKVACNHALTADMELKPLQTSETAWCWYAIDHSENEPKSEQFALRFKTKELAAMFKEKFTECQEQLRSLGMEKGHSGSESKSSDMGSVLGDDRDEGTDENESNEDEVLMSKRVTMCYVQEDGTDETVGLGELVVLYDEDVSGVRIRMKSDKNEVICNHIICRKYQLQCDSAKKCCEWSALDFSTDEPKRRHFKILFSSSNATDEFKQVFEKGLEMAHTSEIEEIQDGVSITGELTKPEIAGYESSQ